MSNGTKKLSKIWKISKMKNIKISKLKLKEINLFKMNSLYKCKRERKSFSKSKKLIEIFSKKLDRLQVTNSILMKIKG